MKTKKPALVICSSEYTENIQQFYYEVMASLMKVLYNSKQLREHPLFVSKFHRR